SSGVELAAEPVARAGDLGEAVVGGLGEPRLVAARGEARRRVLPGAGVDEYRFAVAGHDHAAHIEMVVRFVVVAPFYHHALVVLGRRRREQLRVWLPGGPWLVCCGH